MNHHHALQMMSNRKMIPFFKFTELHIENFEVAHVLPIVA